MRVQLLPCRFAVALLAWGVAFAATSFAKEELQYKFAPNQKLEYAMNQQMEMAFKPEGIPQQQAQSLKTTTDQVMLMTWHVKEVDDKGVAKIEQSIDHIKMKMSIPTLGSFEFDSKSDKEPEGILAQNLVPVFKQLAGAKFEVQMTPYGEVLDIKVPEKVTKAMEGIPGGEMLNEMFSEEGFKKMIQQSSLQFPQDGLDVGNEWGNKFEMENPQLQGKMITETKYKYMGKDNSGLDVFDVKINMDFGEAKGPLTMKVTDQKSKGTILFDREAGHMKSSKIEMSMNMQFSPPAGPPVAAVMDQVVTVQVRKAKE